jgi:uncharacterized lipoprotein YajG
MKTLVLCSVLLVGCASHHQTFIPAAPAPVNNTVEKAPQTSSAPITEADDAELQYQASLVKMQEGFDNETRQLREMFQSQGMKAAEVLRDKFCAVDTYISSRGEHFTKPYCSDR